ncbi:MULTISPECIES: porphobilinogen synthase [Sphingobacterium]|jgi:porphobilinogen synthase|nr:MULTISPECIES: porphobilinogen synthase [Sphingobacterium]APU95667.1 delta-aminolevulinic acid dehydratase [Sphingobacterium sp. B29]MBB1642590.1 delta-aminolevulinic acid dehydratase [Sphingobacterium sp. UME9]MCS4167354.1 porphobilinogen synthase [Sphingobacterium sp. BIGb0116]MDF2853148.1 delta-aminolevulinic acid dehydratase [Sphingobacterium multivorum]OFV19469.1 delta-aminolevulinic acid dehydratase [Sphingobacterium sp. HMSC13C05]
MLQRPRRNRKSAVIRDMIQETRLDASNLIFPLFIVDGQNQKTEVKSMPGIYRYSIDNLLKEVESCLKLGLRSFDLFPNIEESLKDKYATESYRDGSLYLRAIAAVKKNFPEACIVTDVAMDPYSSDGHDGIVENGEILNDETLEVLGKMALAHAQSGADIIAPSDMMDGRIGYIRELLDHNGFTNVSLMSYTAKYASAYYGPFRDALGSAPKHGDKKTYQMNPANAKEALIEAQLDAQEGADFLMVKPGLPYLDIVKLLADNFDLPIAVYNVSGEYAMLKAAIQNGWLDERVILETLLSFRRAGATAILSYHSKEVLEKGFI